MLRVKEITTAYSGMEALQRVSIQLEEGEFVSIIGPNGAGKSTLLKTISGTVKCTSGEIYFSDTNITRRPKDLSIVDGERESRGRGLPF
jgi:ABC-type branched-subunit amino acid transport system ATPase component